jgi:hypothetical protein
MIIYVRNDPEMCSSRDSLAAAVPCISDIATQRPVAGVIDLCKYGEDRFDEDLAASVHELIHVLVRFTFHGHHAWTANVMPAASELLGAQLVLAWRMRSGAEDPVVHVQCS